MADGTAAKPSPEKSDNDQKGEEYNRLLAHAKSYMPFLDIIIHCENLGIQQEHLDKLRSLYEMVDAQRLSTSKLKSCQAVFCSLYSKYHKVLTEDQIKMMNISRNTLNEGDNKTRSSKGKTISKKSDQNINSKSESPNKMSVSSVIKNNAPNNQPDSLKNSDKQNNELVLEKEKNNASSNIKNLDDDSTSITSSLPQFSDSRLRLNKVIGVAVNASIEKLNESDNTPSSVTTEVAKQIYEDLTKQNTNVFKYQNALKDINMDDIDVNHVTKAIESIKSTQVNSVEPPPLPPSDLLDLGLAKVTIDKPKLVVDGNVLSKPHEPLESASSSTSSQPISIQEKLNNEVKIIHKMGSLNEASKQKFITSLKPGTLRDLENSKIVSSSLHIDSLRPVVKLNETSKPAFATNVKNIDPKPLIRDPRIKKNISLNLENGANQFQFPLQTNVQQLNSMPVISQTQNCNPESMNLNRHPNSTFESTQKEMMVHTNCQHELQHSALSTYKTSNVPMNHESSINMPVFNKPCFFENRGNSIISYYINSKPSIQNQYRYNHNDYTFNIQHKDFNQYSNPNQTYVNPPHHDETRYCESGSNSYCNDKFPRRDPRFAKRDQKSSGSQYHSFKEYREAKYGKEKNSYRGSASNNQEHNSYRSHMSENSTFKSSNATKTEIKINNSCNSTGAVNDTASIKSFKIPKIKRKEVADDDNTDKIKKSETFKDNNTDKYKKSEVIKSKTNLKIEMVKDTIESNTKIELAKNISTDKHEKIEVVKGNTTKDSKTKSITNCNDLIDNYSGDNTENECTSDLCKLNKKPKKYSKEKEFEKIIKQARVQSLNDGEVGCGPRTRTRNSLKKKDEVQTLKNDDLDNSKQIDITSIDQKHKTKTKHSLIKKDEVQALKKDSFDDVVLEKCNDNFDKLDDKKACQNTESCVSGSLEAEQNLISSTSKEPSEVELPTEDVCNKIPEENIVSSNEINSTDDIPCNDEIKSILQNQLLLSILRDKDKLDKLTKFLDSPKVHSIIEDQLDTKTVFDKDKSDIVPKKKSKKKKKNKKKKNKVNTASNISSDNENRSELLVSNTSNDDCLNNTNVDETEKVESCSVDSKTNEDLYTEKMSTNQVKCKLSKSKKYPRETFEILKDKCKPELKIVIAKFDKNIKKSDGVQSGDEQSVQVVESKNPGFGSLNVKLVKKKNEIQQSNLQNKPNEKVQFGSLDEPYVLLKPFKVGSVNSAVSTETHSQDEVAATKEGSIKTTTAVTNVLNNKSDIKKPKPKITELDKLHADISEMYDCKEILNVSNVRHCRTKKQINYVNTSIGIPKKGKAPNVDQLNLNVQNNKYVCNMKKLKSTKKLIKCSMFKTNNKLKHSVKKHNKKKTKLKIKKKKQYIKKKSESNNASNNETATSVLPKVLTENDFKDKSYYQTADNLLECKFCYYSDIGLSLVYHYKEQHCEEEVLVSRLPCDCAEKLISESLKENYGFLNFGECIDTKTNACISVNNLFTCVFCQLIFNDIIQFYDHISGHTGEYRYLCKMCPKMYSCENQLEKHISEHLTYDKTDGISLLLRPNPIEKVFGYLCPFCYYVQLDYNNIVEHMKLRHFDEDKRFNNYWTVIRVSMSVMNESCENIVINYTNLVGCLPPLSFDQRVCQTIPKIKNLQGETIPSVAELIVESKKLLQVDAELLIKETQDLQEKKDLQETKMSQLKKSDKLPSYINEPETSTEEPMIEYTLKENFRVCTVADISCQLIGQMLMFNCRISNCQNNPFSTIIVRDFTRHIELDHLHTVWDRKCNECGLKLEKTSEECCTIKDAFNHLISHHLVLKTKEASSNMLNMVDDPIKEQCVSTLSQNNDNSLVTEKKPSVSKIRVVPFHSMAATNLHDSCTIEKVLPVIVNNANNYLPSSETPNITHLDDNIDKTVITEEQFVQITSPKQPEQLSHSEIDTPLELSANQEITNQFTNYHDGFIRIDKVMSLCEDGVMNQLSKKVMPNNSDNIKRKIHINCENVQQVLQKQFVSPGHYIINDGQPISGETYKLINTEYNKCYHKKVKDFPITQLKSKLALQEMIFSPRLLGLYKCMDKACTKIFGQKDLFKLHMKLHFSNADKKHKNQINNVEHFKKCAYCYRVFDDEESLADHIEQQYTFCNYFCPYCFFRAYTPTHVLIHLFHIHSIAKTKILKLEYDKSTSTQQNELLMAVDFHSFVLPFVCNIGSCKFSCYQCEDFVFHLTQEHQQCDKYCCYICDRENNGERYYAFKPNEIVNHLKFHGIDKYQCIFCLFGASNIELMSFHLSMEHFEYNLLCLERSPMNNIYNKNDITNLKIVRLTTPIENGILETISLPPGTSSLSSVPAQNSKKKRPERSTVITTTMKSVHIDDHIQTQRASGSIVINIPDRSKMTDSVPLSPAINNEFIMLDDVNVENDKQEMTVDTCNTSGNNIEMSQPPPDDLNFPDIIVIDDDNDVISNSESQNEEVSKIRTKRKCSTQESNNRLNKAKRLALPVISLDKLFFCDECNESFSDGTAYLHHLNVCPYFKTNQRQCPFCVKSFKTDFHMVEHLKLHGPDRFSCSLCDFTFPSKRSIIYHMKSTHNILYYDYVPVVAGLNDYEKDEFIVYNDITKSTSSCYTCVNCTFTSNNKNTMNLHMKNIHHTDQNEIQILDNSTLNDPVQKWGIKSVQSFVVSNSPVKRGSIKRKSSNDQSNIGANKKKCSNTNLSNTFDNKGLQHQPIMLFSSDTIETIPKAHIFSQQVGCTLCSFRTKVRSNLLLHLNGHKIGHDNTTKEIVNPVPSIGKSELMFDKMINLSASSFEAMNTEKMKIDDINKKIVEVAPQNHQKIKLYPQFIPKNKRYKCSMLSCPYTAVTEDMLKTHILTLHSVLKSYICPHCPPDRNDRIVDFSKIDFHLMHHGENLYGCQYCDYIDFNRSEMKIHMRKNHLLEVTSAQQSNIIVIRQTMLEDDINDKNISKAQSTGAEWVCNICSSGIKYTKDEIISHIFTIHKVSKMFKCPMCPFEHDSNDGKVFEDHYRIKHPSVAVKCLTVCEKVTNVREQHIEPKRLLGFSSMLEQQALESIDTTLVPPACRGIPLEPADDKINNKSRGIITKSPKTQAKSSPIRKQTVLIDNFSVNDSLGEISLTGLYSCPRCNAFETGDVQEFRKHLIKDVNYKMWRCLNCFEMSDSPKKMAWHIKKHGVGYKYEKIECVLKKNWIDRVIDHQNALMYNMKKIKKGPEINVVSSKSITNSKVQSKSSLKKKKDASEKRSLGSQVITATTSNTIIAHQLNNDIIDLVDDSDDE